MERLPKEIVENVLRRLSVFDIVRATCACKFLRSLVVARRITSANPFASLLLIYHPDGRDGAASALLDSCWAYDAHRASWVTLSLAFLRHSLPAYAYPVASDGGLVCFGSGRSFIIFNPITKSWKELPYLTLADQQVDEDSVQAFGLNCNAESGSYDFFVLNHSKSRLPSVAMLTSYSSSSSQWSSMTHMILPDGSCKLHSNAVISCNSTPYTIWQRDGYLTIFAYNNGTWSELDVPECSARILKAFLINVRGKLIMVGAVGAVWLQDTVWERPTSVRVWELNEQSDTWVDIIRMPEPTLHEFHKCVDIDELQCWGKHDSLYLKSLTSDVLMANLTTSEWKWLRDAEIGVETLALIFEPSLSAVP